MLCGRLTGFWQKRRLWTRLSDLKTGIFGASAHLLCICARQITDLRLTDTATYA